jgi:transposase
MKVRIEPRLLREALRLRYGTSLSTREIAHSTGLSRNSLKRLLSHLSDIDLNANQMAKWSDEELYKRLNLTPFHGFRLKAYPDWNWVHRELRNPRVTQELLWREWRATEPDGIAYSQFTAGYRKFLKQQPLSMRQLHLPGDKLFLDFCGQTVPIYLNNQSEPRYAQIFAGVLGYSSYTFACAVWSQRTEDWMHCHVQAFNYFSGVPRLLVPDNLKAAVLKHNKDEVQLNLIYQQLAQHYQTIILPARPRKPKDKAKVEAGVKLIQRWLLAALRHRQFFSLAELNQAISELLPLFNQRPFKRLPNTSRHSLFIETEQSALQPLPIHPYEHADWRFKVRVRSDYLVQYDNHHYSVPSRLVQQQVDVRATVEVVEIFHNHLRVSSHPRQFDSGISMQPEHRPLNHQYYADSEPAALLAWGANVGPALLRHLNYHLTERIDVANGHKAASSLRKEARLHGDERLEEACAYALTIKTFALKSLQSILREQPDKRPSLKALPTPKLVHENLRGAHYFAGEKDNQTC